MFHLLCPNRPTPRTTADRFAYLIHDILLALSFHASRRPQAAPLLLRLGIYFARSRNRLIALLTRQQAGTLRPPRPRPPRPPAARPAAAPPAAAPPARAAEPPPPRLRPPRLRLPRRRTWLFALLPPPPMVANPLAACREALLFLLAEPDMAALIAAAPQAGRLLRPLCNALGLAPDDLPQALRLPPRPPRPPDPARLAAQAQARADRQAARLAARAEAAWGRRFRRQFGLPARPPRDALPFPAQARPPPKRT